jgi:NAD(P)-dependent dehydrogenase (short-subunit alcohol dehydrogenase family)
VTRHTIVVVGATSGIGEAVALHLAHRGHRVLAVGRNPKRAAALRRRLGANSQVLRYDIATRAGCAELVQAVGDHTGKVDALINNAGVMAPERRLTADGRELNFAVHHLAPFAVTSGLLPLLRNGAMPGDPDGHDRPRIVNVSSASHRNSRADNRPVTLDLSDLDSARDYDPFLTYSRSKLANLLFTYELVRRHGHELVANAIHPGLVRTGIGRSFGPRQILTPSFPRIRVLATQLTAISPGRAAPAVAALATEPVSTNGGYYDRAVPTRSSEPSYDTHTAARLWQLTEQLCGPLNR